MVELHDGLECTPISASALRQSAPRRFFYPRGLHSPKAVRLTMVSDCASCQGLDGKGKGGWNGTAVFDLTTPKPEKRRQISLRGYLERS